MLVLVREEKVDFKFHLQRPGPMPAHHVTGFTHIRCRCYTHNDKTEARNVIYLLGHDLNSLMHQIRAPQIQPQEILDKTVNELRKDWSSEFPSSLNVSSRAPSYRACPNILDAPLWISVTKSLPPPLLRPFIFYYMSRHG